jgi:hypothetical protein
MGVNAIARRLKSEGLAGSPASVSGVLAEAREAANGGQASPAAAPSPSQLLGAGDVPAGEDVAGLGTPEHEARVALDHLAAAEAIHQRLRLRHKVISERIDSEVKKPAPDWSLFKQLYAAERVAREDIEATRPRVERKPEDDPQNLELARVVVATLRARVEAGRAARAGAAA